MNNEATQREQSNTDFRTLWHLLVYRLYKALLIPRQGQVEEEWEVTEQPPKVDMILSHNGDQWTEEQRLVLPDGVRDRDCQYHVFEFKITQSLSKDAFKQAFTYDYLFPYRKHVKSHEFQTYIVSAKTPQKKPLASWGYKQTELPGVYQSTIPAYDDVVLLVPNQLRDTPYNNYLRLFASREKVRVSALESLLQTHAPQQTDDMTEEEIVRVLWAVGQAYGIEMEGVDMTNEITIDRLFEMGDKLRLSVIAGATPEERLMGLKPEEIFTVYKPEERLMGLKPEERLMGLKPEERLMGLKPEERLMGLKPEEVFTMYKPEERVVGLTTEEKRQLLQELQRSLEEEVQEEFVSKEGEMEAIQLPESTEEAQPSNLVEADAGSEQSYQKIEDGTVEQIQPDS